MLAARRRRFGASAAGYVLVVDPERIDAKRFERLIGEAQRVLGVDPEAARGLYERALGLWRGAPLAELSQFDFARREAERLEELHAVAVEGVVEARLALGEHERVIGQITALVAAEPLRERPRRLLMLALYRSGRHAEALAAYRDACAALDEIGLQPGPELRALEQAILRHDPSLGAPSAAEVRGIAGRDRGRARLYERWWSCAARFGDGDDAVHRHRGLDGATGSARGSVSGAAGGARSRDPRRDRGDGRIRGEHLR